MIGSFSRWPAWGPFGITVCEEMLFEDFKMTDMAAILDIGTE